MFYECPQRKNKATKDVKDVVKGKDASRGKKQKPLAWLLPDMIGELMKL